MTTTTPPTTTPEMCRFHSVSTDNYEVRLWNSASLARTQRPSMFDLVSLR